MKILLDECVTKKLKKHLEIHKVFTVANMNWLGLKNGNLMKKAIEEGFDVILTIDKNLQFQNNMNRYEVSIVIFHCENSKIETLIPFVAEFENQPVLSLKQGNPPRRSKGTKYK
jgi:predicted nuclease of predicted toxin-antitoxin system